MPIPPASKWPNEVRTYEASSRPYTDVDPSPAQCACMFFTVPESLARGLVECEAAGTITMWHTRETSGSERHETRRSSPNVAG